MLFLIGVAQKGYSGSPVLNEQEKVIGMLIRKFIRN